MLSVWEFPRDFEILHLLCIFIDRSFCPGQIYPSSGDWYLRRSSLPTVQSEAFHIWKTCHLHRGRQSHSKLQGPLFWLGNQLLGRFQEATPVLSSSRNAGNRDALQQISSEYCESYSSSSYLTIFQRTSANRLRSSDRTANRWGIRNIRFVSLKALLLELLDLNLSKTFHRDLENNIMALINSQIQFVQILHANIEYYLECSTSYHETKIHTFREMCMRMSHLHYDRVLSDLSINVGNISAISTVFLQYVTVRNYA